MSAAPHIRIPDPAAVPPAGSPALHCRLDGLYRLSQASPHVFASPLGPFSAGGVALMLPRFVFFGPNANDDSWRLALLASLDSRDLSGAFVLADLIEHLASDAALGHGLNLSFFPVLDVAGFALGHPDRSLARVHWPGSDLPEIALLEREARTRPYHGFVRLETAPAGETDLLLRVNGTTVDALSPELIHLDPNLTRGLPVRAEYAITERGAESSGPLSLAEDLPYPPFELTLGLPADWPEDRGRSVACTLLERFLIRYRAYQAYGQNL